ncbi:alpha/beta hydrolase [Parvicella tangerina]|uniref:alpha/beta hydrolase n=1 Tax=Parvicella tangerina TaxID=2829795 RepID=UPI00215C5DDE|nr:lysophospholipase [Parvicella tangerina]
MSKRASRTGYPSVTDYSLNVDTLILESHDGHKLYGLWCDANTPEVQGTILMIHGIGSCKDHFIPKAQWLANNGFNSVLVDLRGHGMSEGEYITYGFNEVPDLKLFLDCMTLHHHANNIGVWGQSLGGAIGLQLMAADDRVKFGIIESTYCTFDEVVHDYSYRMFGVPLGWLNDYVIWRAQSVAQFDKTNINPEEACKKVHQPILLVHGTADDRIDITYGKRNFNALASENKEFVQIEGANHVNVWEVGGETYNKKCLEFLNNP